MDGDVILLALALPEMTAEHNYIHCITQVMNRMSPMVGNRITIQNNRSDTHMLVADSARLYQVVHVVLVNAFKYTRKVRGWID